MVILLLGLSCASSVARDTGNGDTGQPVDTADSGEHTGDGDTASDHTGDTGHETGDTGPPQDLDADGFDSNDDCDDLDPTRYPGATEYCDGKDHDCDGVLNEGTRCSDLLVPDLVLAGRIEGGAGSIVADVTGDGLADIDVWGSIDESYPGSPYTMIYAQGTLPGVGPHTDAYALPGFRVHWTAPYCDFAGAEAWPDAAGDVDGDGVNDLAVVSKVEHCDGGVPILFGPFEGGHSFDLGDSGTAWLPTGVDADTLRGTQWGAVRRKGDFDGDGKADHLLTGAVSNYVFFGGAYSTGDQTAAMYFYDDCNSGDAGEDVDADGLDDIVLLTDDREVLLVSGSSVQPGIVAIVDLAVLRVSPDTDAGTLSYLTDPGLLGDLDGDGYGEIHAAGRDARGECGDECEELLYFSGDVRGEVPASAARGSFATTSGGHFAEFSNTSTFDFDADGLEDIALAIRDDAGTGICVLPGIMGLPAAALEPVPDTRLCFDYGDSASLRGGPDTNGDGFDDAILVWDSDPSGGHSGRSDVVLGFAVPWDDPSYW